MERVLTSERLVFPVEGLEYVIAALPIPRLAVVRQRSMRKGRIDEGLLMIRTLEAGIVEPRLTERDVTDLMKTHPEMALHLAVRIAELTTG